MSYATKQIGVFGSFDYQLYHTKDGVPVSLVHDLPLWADKEKGIINIFIEIPRGTHAKLECHKTKPFNPITQDVKNGKLRYIAAQYPFPYNYGAIPQTWENPSTIDAETKAKGDNDPVDACDIGTKLHATGAIVQAKVLGGYAMIDEGEMDWKFITVDVTDEHADKLNDASDIDKVFPGKTQQIFEFIRDYKVPDGKPQAQFGFGGKLLDKAFMLNVLEETHKEWDHMVQKKTASNWALKCTQTQGAEHVSAADAEAELSKIFLAYVRSQGSNPMRAKL
jgi:inorganic pyrophosphatase